MCAAPVQSRVRSINVHQVIEATRAPATAGLLDKFVASWSWVRTWSESWETTSVIKVFKKCSSGLGSTAVHGCVFVILKYICDRTENAFSRALDILWEIKESSARCRRYPRPPPREGASSGLQPLHESHTVTMWQNGPSLIFEFKRDSRPQKCNMPRFEDMNGRAVIEGKAFAAAKIKRKGKEKEFQRQKRVFPNVAELINITQLKSITLKRVFTFYFCFNYYVHIISRDHILHL